MEPIKDYEERIRTAGYKLTGQIKTLDNGVSDAKETIAACNKLLAHMETFMRRDVRKEVDQMARELEVRIGRLVYASNRAIEQNSNIRSILERGIDNER